MQPAPRGAAGPMDGQRKDLSSGRATIEFTRHIDRPALGFDKSQMAIVAADTGNQTAHNRRRVEREFLKDRLVGQGADLAFGDILNHQIVLYIKTNLPT